MAEFGLAASILQVIDFGTKFVTTAYEIHNSTRDGIQGFENLQENSKNLQDVLQRLQSQTTVVAAECRGGDSDGILALATQCSKTLSEMLETLARVQPPKKRNIFKSLRSTFAQYWNQDRIEALRVQLNDYRLQITLDLAVSIEQSAQKASKQQMVTLKKLDGLTRRNEDISAKLTAPTLENTSFGSSVIDYLVRGVAQKTQLRRAIMDALSAGQDDGRTPITIQLSKAHRKRLERLFLARLKYTGMDDRELTIPEAHESTFRWIFEDSQHESVQWASFTGWLESDEQLYWITGKAGAGKSTLMKYLTQPSRKRFHKANATKSAYKTNRCDQYLRKWAGNNPLITVNFYFWAGSTRTQRSQKGFFLTVLFQLLHAYPEAIPSVSPRRWELLSLFDEILDEFTEPEVRDMFYRAVTYVTAKARVALFVDGLDEFEGDLGVLITTMRNIILNTNIKLCVASRPWNEFQQAFENKPSLRIQDLTYSDISRYVTTKFDENSHFQKLKSRNLGNAEKLINDVVSKASGVFLWVKIVVDSLLMGISQGDRMIDLQKRLDVLPPDLKQLYARIIDGIDPLYQHHAAEYFKLMRSCFDTPSALLFSFADEPDLWDMATSNDVIPLSKDELMSRVDQISLRLNSRCKGLLEVFYKSRDFAFPGPKVHYLHRTVRDYFESDEAKERIHNRLGNPLDSHLNLMAATLALSKAWDKCGKLVPEFILHAQMVSRERELDSVKLLDSLWEALRVRQPWSIEFLMHFETAFGNYDSSNLYKVLNPADQVLWLSVRYGIAQYVMARSTKGCLIHGLESLRLLRKSSNSNYRRTWAPVKLSLRSLYSDPVDIAYPLLDVPFLEQLPDAHDHNLKVEMVKTLLNNGADPNYSFKHQERGLLTELSPWKRAIMQIVEEFDFKRKRQVKRQESLERIARMMIDHGATCNRSTVKSAVSILVEVKTFQTADIPEHINSITTIIYPALKAMKKDRTMTKLHLRREYRL